MWVSGLTVRVGGAQGRVGRQFLLDPDGEESEKVDASLTLAMMPSLDLVRWPRSLLPQPTT